MSHFARRAEIALAPYQEAHHYGDDTRSMLQDLLADLHHWADQNGLDWDEAERWGDIHYTAETTGEEIG